MLKMQLSPLPVQFMHSAMEPQHIHHRIQTHVPLLSRRETKIPENCCIYVKIFFSPCFPESQLKLQRGMGFVYLFSQMDNCMVLSDKCSKKIRVIKECE